MSANFYNCSAIMVGADFHKYWTWIPPALVPPIPAIGLYVTGAYYDLQPCDDPATKTASVTTGGKRMVQGACKLTLLLHVPTGLSVPPGLPHPVMVPVEMAFIFNWSSSVPLIRRRCVTGEGKPLAVCRDGAMGDNINCGELVKLPTGIVHADTTVMTEPTVGDAAEAILVDILADAVVGFIADKLLGKGIEKWVKKRVAEVLVKPVARFAEKIAKDLLKKLLKRKEKASTSASETAHVTALLTNLGVTHV